MASTRVHLNNVGKRRIKERSSTGVNIFRVSIYLLIIGTFTIVSLYSRYRGVLNKEELQLETESFIEIVSDELEVISHEKDKIACIVINNPRTASIYSSNFLNWHGSQYYLETRQTIKGCETYRKNLGNESMPLIKLSFQNEINDVLKRMENVDEKFIFIQGDEFCRFSNNLLFDESIHVSQYYEDDMDLFHIPIGPRSEFFEISKIKKPLKLSERGFLFNFIGSLTNSDRTDLKNVIQSNLWNAKIYTKFIDKWTLNTEKSANFVQPEEYYSILSNSIFTLCPMGHNPETFRLFEAIEAESIPIIAKTENYNQHSCFRSLNPYLDIQRKFIIELESWQDLPSVLFNLLSHEDKMQELHENLKLFKKTYWKNKAQHLDCILNRNELCIPKPKKQPLITGCGRSGTFSISKFLEKVGVAATHESFKYNHVAVSWLYAAKDESYPFEFPLAKHRIEAESRDKNIFSDTFLLVRNPLKVISSIRRCFCGRGNRNTKMGKKSEIKSWKFIERNLDVDFKNLPYDSIERASLYWLEWNKKILREHSQVTILRLEDLTPESLLTVLGKSGKNHTKLPDSIGNNAFHISKKKVYEDITISDIMAVNLTLAEEIESLATYFGYTIEQN